jgi:glycosyltransferase involved in cell wall biosynthesis
VAGDHAEAPLISVVIPTMNSAAVLDAALQSLADQSFRDFEVIVSDGASKDGTLAVAEGFVAALPRLHIDSRPDSGVYDAINRGVLLSRGAWFLVLGSDDRIHAPDTLATIAAHLRCAAQAQIVYGDVCMMAENRYGVPVGGRYMGPVSLSMFLHTNICQQAIFYRRELFDALGGFELRYRMCADWAFNLRAEFITPAHWVDVVVADYAATGLSAAGNDEAFVADFPAMLRVGLIRNADKRAYWPLQKRMLREADRLRRRGHWAGFADYLGTYLALLARRIPALLRRD